MDFIHDDGGRALAGFRGTAAGDCAVRAAAIATGVPYRVVYDEINLLAKRERPRKESKRSNARTGVWPKTLGRLLEGAGFTWVPTMGIGTGCTTHLKADELPRGVVVARVSKHFTVVIDGVLHDLSDCSRDGTRCVYGFWHRT